jgi:regulatory protein
VDQNKIDVGLIERWALAYLGRYASSAENLRRVLQRRVRRRLGKDTEALRMVAPLIDEVVERYCHSGLIDDAAYAARRAESLHQRGESVAKIRARLVTKGVAGSVAADALAALRANAADPDLVAACAFARRRRLGPYRSRGVLDPTRELAAFARAGFSRRIAEMVLACKDIETVDALAGENSD